MANPLVTPNMSLTEPGIGNTLSPTWAQDLNNNFTTLDQHNHAPGNGVQITPAGLDISSDLSFVGNNAIALRATRYNPLSLGSLTGTDLNELVVSGVDLYYIDGLGNQVRLTQNGSIVGTTGSISGLVSPASASYIGGSDTFVWQSGSGIAANMDFATAILRYPSTGYPTPSGNFISLQVPSTISSGYALTLPIPPASTSFLTMTPAGVISATPLFPLPGANIAAGSITTTQIASGTILGSNIATQTITGSNIVNQTIGASQVANQGVAQYNLAYKEVFTNPNQATITVNGSNTVLNVTTVSGGTYYGGPLQIQMGTVQGGLGYTDGINGSLSITSASNGSGLLFIVQLYEVISAVSNLVGTSKVIIPVNANAAGTSLIVVNPLPPMEMIRQPSSGAGTSVTYEIYVQCITQGSIAIAGSTALTVGANLRVYEL